MGDLCIMENIQASVSKDKKTLTLVIDLTHDAGKSGSGKNSMVAKTGGNIPFVEAGVILGLNCYRAK